MPLLLTVSSTLTGKSRSCGSWNNGVRHETWPESTNRAEVVLVPNAHERFGESRNPLPRTVTVVHPVVGPAAGVARCRTGALDRTSSVQEPSVSAPLLDTPTRTVDGDAVDVDDDDIIASTTGAVVQATASEDTNRACATSTVVSWLLVEAVDETLEFSPKLKMHDNNFDGEKPLPVTTISDTEPGGTLSGRTPADREKYIVQDTFIYLQRTMLTCKRTVW